MRSQPRCATRKIPSPICAGACRSETYEIPFSSMMFVAQTASGIRCAVVRRLRGACRAAGQSESSLSATRSKSGRAKAAGRRRWPRRWDKALRRRPSATHSCPRCGQRATRSTRNAAAGCSGRMRARLDMSRPHGYPRRPERSCCWCRDGFLALASDYDRYDMRSVDACRTHERARNRWAANCARSRPAIPTARASRASRKAMTRPRCC